MRSRLPTLRTNKADLVTSFFSADEMVVNPVLGIDPLLDVSSPGAAFDFQGHYDRRCFPGTWEQYIADITIRPAEPASSMRGPAGVGKLAIAPTCADKLDILMVHFSSVSRNTTIHHTYSLPLLINLPLRSLIIVHLLMEEDLKGQDTR